MSDWYTRALEFLTEEAIEQTGVNETQFNVVYSFLNEIGLIDYDIEKEVLYERYVNEYEED